MWLFLCRSTIFGAALLFIESPLTQVIVDDALFISVESSVLEKNFICECYQSKAFLRSKWMKCSGMLFNDFSMVFMKTTTLKYSCIWAQSWGEYCLCSHNAVERACGDQITHENQTRLSASLKRECLNAFSVINFFYCSFESFVFFVKLGFLQCSCVTCVVLWSEILRISH